MKLHSLEIENFRAIKHLELDFTDELSRPRLMTLIVGPNGSGKTSIFDAIDTVVKTAAIDTVVKIDENKRKDRLREGLILSSQQIVRGRGNQAKVVFEYSLSEDESAEIINVYSLMKIRGFLQKAKISSYIFTQDSLKASWSFPSKNSKNLVDISYDRSPNLKVLGAREVVNQAIGRSMSSSIMFEKIGGVCYLDQRRTLQLSKSFHGNVKDDFEYNDVLSWLFVYYARHNTWNEEKYGESYWARVKRLFNKICYPSELVGLESGPDSDTLILRKNGFDYDLYQMSSGEHQILRILVGLTLAIAKNSIVLIDEIELNLHPTWQKRLIRALRDDTDNNQYIFTTHSPDVIGLFYDSEIIHLGNLSE